MIKCHCIKPANMYKIKYNITNATSNLSTNIKKFGRNLSATHIKAISPISSNTSPPYYLHPSQLQPGI